MTTGTNALLAWFRQPSTRSQTKPNEARSQSNATRRQYRINIRRTCYRCQQEGHYARNCPHVTTPKPTKTKMEKMQSLLKSMTPTERAQFKREISPQMATIQAHLRTMTTNELIEFKRQINPSATQLLMTALKNKKTSINTLSRETSPRINRTFEGTPPSRETGPHPNKSMKKLAQALKKRAKHEAKQQVHTPSSNHSFETLAKALKPPANTSRPNPSVKKLANALKQCTKWESKHPTCLCMKRFKKLRKPEMTPLPVTDDSSTNSDTLCNSEELENDEAEPITDLTRNMKRLSLTPTKSVTFDLSEVDPDTPSHDIGDLTDDQSDDTEEPTFQNNKTNARLVRTAWLRKTSENVYMSNRKSMTLKVYVHAAHRRTEAPALLDSGATENFLNLTYAKWLKLPFKCLPYE